MEANKHDPRTARCAWCGKEAKHQIVLQPGGTGARGRVRMPQTAPVCAQHYAQFHMVDEIGDHRASTGW